MKRVSLAFALLALGACDQGPQYTADDLKAVDSEFSDYAQTNGIYAAFDKYLAEDTVSINPGEQPVIGHAAVMQGFEGIPETTTLVWHPVHADISKSSDLGYTWGRYTLSYLNAEGETVTSHGKYITIWKLQEDGSWRAVLDGGSSNPPPDEE